MGQPPQLPLPPPQPLPGWLGPIVTITTQVGVPTVVAGVLLYFVLFRVDGALKVIQENEEARTRIVSAMQDTIVAALDRQTKEFDESFKENIQANKEIAARLERVPWKPQ
jgi:hypothetical protein